MAFFPTVSLSGLKVGSVAKNYGSKTHSGKSQTRRAGTTLLTFGLSLSGLARADAAAVWAFVQAQNGTFGRFEFFPSAMKDCANPAAPALATVAAIANARQKTLILSGLPANSTVYQAGDFVRFANHSKVYLLAADVVTDASGQGVAILTYELVSALPANTQARFRDVSVQCSLANDEQAINIAPPFIQDCTLDFIEVL